MARKRIHRIKLNNGKSAVIDAEDRELVSPYTWIAWKPQGSEIYYAKAHIRGTGKVGRHVFLHNLIVGYKFVDHADGDGLNNRRNNLRHATKSQNAANSKPRHNASGFKGVGKNHARWQARIRVNQQDKYLGTFDTRRDAAMAYDAAAIKAFGRFAVTNRMLGRL